LTVAVGLAERGKRTLVTRPAARYASGGSANPTWTAVALARRLARQIGAS
jgi:hypothetical protein